MSIVLVGSTSGSCTLQEQAVAGNTTLTLPTVSGTLITTGSSGQSIPKAALPTGSVLQVVNASYSTQTSTTSSTYTDTGLSATITPTSTSSKILVFIDQNGVGKSTTDTQVRIRLLRGSSTLIVLDILAAYNGNTNVLAVGSVSTNYLDSPATTSPVTYKTQFSSSANSADVLVQWSSATSTITLMEIAA